jgi:high-affinity Fe2+/Pb2+ permease
MADRTRTGRALVITAAASAVLGVICIASMWSIRGGIYLFIAGFLLLLLAAGSFVGWLVVKSLRRG